MMSLTYSRPRAQRGQAMTEFLVAAMFVMGVLFLAIAMLGKFNDVRNKTLMGSRYVAWERTVWLDSDAREKGMHSDFDWFYGNAGASNKNDAELHNEYIQRILAPGSKPSNTDKQTAGLPAMPVMWNNHGGEAFVSDDANIAVTTSIRPTPAPQLDQYSGQVFGKIPTVGHGTFNAKIGLATENLQAATVSVSVAQNNATLQRLFGNTFNGLTFRDTSVILSNSWVPNGRNSAWNLSTQAVPVRQFDIIDPTLYKPLQKYSPDIATLDMRSPGGKDIVPKDRLAP
ncbi:hypothetical protein QS306_16955 [Paraburkholderia bonniea]|uniref:hypothetical protein n=1 Tax=Paraburkholderia bonniea TaxID=2152891 RepID=UPI0025740D2B|nr:hypothetical protein [Paraburkholderia bonniea]WJF91759.1 hypothetical protein QS306_16955 [Paraburkholderia bonniea]WJF95079.1 hypothetical protein QS308_16960 [Paraburkholderia bonniea]